MVYYNEDGSVTSNAAPRTLIGDNAIIAAKDAEIARLADAADNHNAAWVAACDRIAALEAERDEARALLAMAYDVAANAASKRAAWWGSEWGNSDNCRHTAGLSDGAHCVYNDIRALTPSDAAAALAARDAAMRNEGRKSVKVKPLVWKEATGDDYRKGECFYARSIIDLTPISVTNSRNGWWLNTNSETYPTIEAAQAAAQADYEARILAALEPEGGE